MLSGKNILIGVTGSIAAYKAVELIRRLKDEGAATRVVLTEAACRFVSPLTFEAVSDLPVEINMFHDPFSHITLAKESDIFIVAPATANSISKFATGIADNLLTTVWLVYSGPAVIVPAMNWKMYENSIIQKHINYLKEREITFIDPVVGDLACGDKEKIGRMAEVSDIIESLHSLLSEKDLSEHKILITSGPTREPLDPVRFISNRSSGKMGFALARMALRRGAEVTLISGPTCEKPPAGASFIKVETSQELENAVKTTISGHTVLIMAAAVADFKPSATRSSKASKADMLDLHLEKTTDILQEIGKQKGDMIVIGFAAETGKAIDKAKEKLKRKNLDLIVLNDITQDGAGFDVGTNIVTLIDKEGVFKDYPLMKKEEVANIILTKIKSCTISH